MQIRGVLAVVVLVVGLGSPLIGWAPDLSRHFGGITGTFVLLNGRTGELTRYNAERASTRFTPCSTFKVPNTLIALETGAAPDADYLLRYDPALKLEGQGPGGSWGRDNTLRSAFSNSVVWYYQEMARRAGAERMQAMVQRFGYGNADTSGGVDRFWLGSSLRISPDEQVQFLKRMVEERLGLSARTMRLAREIMKVEQTSRWTLSAKTGACEGGNGDKDKAIWYVGWVERADTTYYFALEMGEPDYGEAFNTRVTRARAILTDLGVLD